MIYAGNMVFWLYSAYFDGRRKDDNYVIISAFVQCPFLRPYEDLQVLKLINHVHNKALT